MNWLQFKPACIGLHAFGTVPCAHTAGAIGHFWFYANLWCKFACQLFMMLAYISEICYCCLIDINISCQRAKGFDLVFIIQMRIFMTFLHQYICILRIILVRNCGKLFDIGYLSYFSNVNTHTGLLVLSWFVRLLCMGDFLIVV